MTDRALDLIPYLSVPDAEELIETHTRFANELLRESALNALAAIGTKKAGEVIFQAFLYYEKKVPDARAKEESRWMVSLVAALKALKAIGTVETERLYQDALETLGDRISAEERKGFQSPENDQRMGVTGLRKEIAQRRRIMAEVLRP